MEKVFITGASGYIGAASAAACRREGWQVAGLARTESAAAMLAQRGIAAIPGDLRDPATFLDAVRSADLVIHAGATADADFPLVDRASVEAMVGALAGTGKTFIYTSGSWVLGSTGNPGADESATTNPLPEGQARAALERWLQTVGSTGGRAMIVRPGFVYGGGGGIVAGFVKQARHEGVVRYVGTGLNRVSMVHIDDLAALYILAARKGVDGAIYHGVSGAPLPYRDLARVVAVLAGLPEDRVHSWPVEEARKTLGWYADGFLMDSNLVSHRTQAALGWRPTRRDPAEELALEGRSAAQA